MPTSLPQICRVAMEGSFNSERFVNVIHFWQRSNTAWTPTGIGVLASILEGAAAVNNAWLHIHQTMDAGSVYDTFTYTTLDNVSPIQVSRAVNLAGTSAGSDMPPMLAAVIKWQTALASRRGRGRSYLSGLNSGFVNGTNSDRLATTVTGDLQTRVTEFVAAWAASSTIGFVILSETDRAANALTPYREVTAGSPNPLICVQRRRRERTL